MLRMTDGWPSLSGLLTAMAWTMLTLPGVLSAHPLSSQHQQQQKCSLASGQWVYDASLPLYNGDTCRQYIRSSQNCQRQGRTDMSYQKYRYKPSGCSVRRLKPALLASVLRRKRVMVFGDSVSKNLLSSIVCILNAAAPGNMTDYRDSYSGQVVYGQKLGAYHIRVGSVFSSWLMHAEKYPEAGIRVNKVYLDRVDDRIQAYINVTDVAIFQATDWFGPARARWFVGGKETQLTTSDAYAKSLATLKRFLQQSAFKGRAIMVGVSPKHYDVPVSGVPKGRCRGINSPLQTSQASQLFKSDTSSLSFRSIQMTALAGSSIQYIDVLPMSEARPDGHVQNWSKPGGAPESKKDDCLHWCEAGVTDAWVEMMYQTLRFG